MSDSVLEFSPTIGAIAGALAKAQGEMKDAVKDAVNPHFKNKYATLSSIREAVTPALTKNGLCVAQYFDPNVQSPDMVVVVTTMMHSSGEWIRSRLCVPLSKKDAQGMGSAISYGRRYALAAICNIASDEDDDANAVTGKPAPAAAPPAQSGVDVASLIKALAEAKDTDALAKAILAVGRVKEKLSKDELARCQAAREERVRELEAQEKAA